MSPLAKYPSLAARSVLVTGGSSGIGASIVEEFAAQETRVAFIGRNQDSAHAVITACEKRGGTRPLFLPCDLLDINALSSAVSDAAAANGPITVLVNNAASDDRHLTKDVTPEYWDQQMNVNIRHQFFAIQSIAPMMRSAGGGAIINVGSTSWMLKHSIYPGYATAKAAIWGLTRAMAGELGVDNIRVNCVSPGWTFTPRQLRLWWSAEKEQGLLERQLLKHKIEPRDVAATILFLASDDARSITAQNIVVDCGET